MVQECSGIHDGRGKGMMVERWKIKNKNKVNGYDGTKFCWAICIQRIFQPLNFYK